MGSYLCCISRTDVCDQYYYDQFITEYKREALLRSIEAKKSKPIDIKSTLIEKYEDKLSQQY